MFASTLKRGVASTAAAAMLAVCISTASAAPRAVMRPNGLGPSPDAGSFRQILSEGGTAAAYYLGNLMDILGSPIACSGTSFDRNCSAESNLTTKTLNYQYLYAAVGTGAAQLDFVNRKSGTAGKPAQTPAPVFADPFDSYSNALTNVGYATGWAGSAPSSVPEDTIHFAAGDAPIPLGPAENPAYVPPGFVQYSDSLAAYNGNDITGGGFNPNRGPAIVQPIVATGVSVIFNNTGLSVPAGGRLNLTQDDLCGIFTGVYTNWNETSADPGNQKITIVHRSDGSGTTFLFAYDMSEMCSSANPAIAAGLAGVPTSAHFWGGPSNLRTQGVGTDSNNIVGTTIPIDTTAPEVVWPASSLGISKSSGVLSAVAATAGSIGYISPSYATPATISEANVENYNGGFESATSTTIADSFSTFEKGVSPEPNPPGYPKATNSAALYFPFPTSPSGYPLVGVSYVYFYECTPTRLALQHAGIRRLFEYEANASTYAKAAAVAAFWNLDVLPIGELSLLAKAVNNLKTGPYTGTYTNPATGAIAKFSCTDS